MGKNKKKTNSVFKVTGAKSLKMKAKAKVVKSDLKNLKAKSKEKVIEIDKALDGLQEKLRKSAPEVKQVSEKKATKLPSSINLDENTEKVNKEAVDKMETMQL